MFQKPQPSVSVVIPVYNGGDAFHTCLENLRQVNPPPDEVIVVADGDTDGSWRVAEQFGAHVIRIPGPSGNSTPRNVGAKAARGDIILFFDADVAVPPDVVQRVRDIFLREPEIDAIIGSYDDQPGASNFLSQYKNLLHHYTHQVAHEDANVFFTGIGAIKRQVFLDAGGFDESYWYMQDVELGHRLTLAGHKIRLVKDLQARHLKRYIPLSLLRSEIIERALPWTRIILSYRIARRDLNLTYASRLSVILVLALLASLVAAFWFPVVLMVAIAAAALLLLLNLPVYRFFWQKRGAWFTIRVVPWHWFYYLYGGFAFGVGVLLYSIDPGYLSGRQLSRLGLLARRRRSRVND